MADRTDIDALLIGALYGELTPADETRLAAHLESHPGDRTALADLERTRSVVRENRLLAAQVDPPQGISARLLQEAARRAPRGPAAEGWFQRFVRSVMAHPAMAAATMLVLVLGVASALYVRGVGSVASEAPQPRAASTATSEAMVVQQARESAPEHAAAPAEPPRNEATVASAPASRPAATPPADPAAAATGHTMGTRASMDTSAGGAPQPSKPAPDRNQPFDDVASEKRLAVAKKSRGIELRRAEPVPKELDDEKPRQAYRKADKADKSETSAGPVQLRGETDGAGAGAAAANQGRYPVTAAVPESPAPPPAPAQAAPPPAVAAAPAAPPPFKLKVADSKRAPAAPKPQAKAQADSADDKPSADPALLDWAHKQHSQVRSLVAADNCQGAADAAVEIYNRAPDYYAANVVTDRQIKHCLAYVNGERERVDRQRAASKPAAEAPARK